MKEVPSDKKLILFDGVCNLCNSSVQRVLKYDTRQIFLFASLDSETGKSVMDTYDLDPGVTDSIILYEPDKGISIKSTAVLRIVRTFSFPKNALSIFLIIPAIVRNWVYDYVARNRYKWYGKRDHCMVPTPELSNRFLK